MPVSVYYHEMCTIPFILEIEFAYRNVAKFYKLSFLPEEKPPITPPAQSEIYVSEICRKITPSLGALSSGCEALHLE